MPERLRVRGAIVRRVEERSVWRTLGLRMGGWLALLAALLAPACKPKPPPDDGRLHIVQRRDFTPAEFGIGRPHTPDPACNREIDILLDEVRHCFNDRPSPACDRLQEANSASITRLKNSRRCAR
jgi:hypothetical protein